MKTKILTFIFSTLLFYSCNKINNEVSEDSFLKLWYNQPAANWDEALPIGNGHIGAMVHGNVSREYFQLNDDCFWAGSPYQNNNPEALQYFRKIQELMGQKKYQ